jgi:nicotinamidase-related amidase
MVNGFVKEGTLAAPSIGRIIPRQKELLNEALVNSDIGLVFIRDSHTPDAIEFNTYPSHCLAGSLESEVIAELKEFEKYSLVYLKNSTNLIFAPNIQQDLLSLDKLERVRLMGCLSEVCVLNGAIGLRTFFDQNNKNVDVLVHRDAIDTYDAANHNANMITEKAISDMKSNGIKIIGEE